MEVLYRPPEDREPDTQYHDLLERIYTEGREVAPIQGEKAKMIVGAQLRYDMSNGFPAITERDVSGNLFKGALAEHIAFLNGARTQAELEAFGCKWWDRWVTADKCADFDLEPGDLGDGSYGAAWTSFPTAEGESFDQIPHFMQQITERPYLRTHVITPWIPQYTLQHEGLTRRVVVAPCHGMIHALADPATRELSIHHIQRSGDFPVGVPFNMIQYAAFGMMVARLTNYRFVEYVHSFSDVHIYESQYENVEEILNRPARTLGTVSIIHAEAIDNIKDFRPEHFELTDYEPHPAMRMPTPV